MRARVDHAIRGEAVRQVHVGSGIAEAKLQDGHAGNAMTLAERVDLGSDVTQVLGEERQSSQGFAQLVEKIILGTIHPAAIDCGRLVGRNLPELLEAAKVVETNVVAGLSGPAQTVNPPIVAAAAHRTPIVERISP